MFNVRTTMLYDDENTPASQGGEFWSCDRSEKERDVIRLR